MYLQAEKALFVHIKQERSGRTFPSPCPSHGTKLKLTFFSMQQNTKNFHALNSTSRRVKGSVADSVVFLIRQNISGPKTSLHVVAFKQEKLFHKTKNVGNCCFLFTIQGL